MVVAIVSIVCAVMGVLVGLLVARVKGAQENAILRTKLEASESSLQQAKESAAKQLGDAKEQAAQQLTEAKEQAAKQLADAKVEADRRLAESKAEAAEQLCAAKADAERRLIESKNEAEKQLASAKDEAAKQMEGLKKDREETFEKQLATMKSEFEAASQKLLKERSEDFKGVNKEAMDKITQPLLLQIEEMRKALKDNKEGSDKNISVLNSTIENMMKQSNKLSEDAVNLTNALKNRGKVQGDWGEQVLSNILRDSGLRENEEFFTQKNYKTANGENVRTDVVVRASSGSMIVVDSKVSLTAYSDYLAAEDDIAREQASKANLDSVWSHVEELVRVNYAKVVPDAVPYVLMFVPNEGSYILAMNRDPQIGIKAYKKGIIIINPTNLMLALSLILLTWQNTRQEETCLKIMDAATSLYEKFCGFSDNFARIGAQMQTACKTYEEARGQLNGGPGNIINRFEGIKKLGIVTTKKVSEKLL